MPLCMMILELFDFWGLVIGWSNSEQPQDQKLPKGYIGW